MIEATPDTALLHVFFTEHPDHPAVTIDDGAIAHVCRPCAMEVAERFPCECQVGINCVCCVSYRPCDCGPDDRRGCRVCATKDELGNVLPWLL